MTAVEDRVTEVMALADAATEGPWEPVVDGSDGRAREHSVWAGDMSGSYAAEWIATRADAAFIAHARQDVPALAAAIRAVLDLHVHEDRPAAPDLVEPDGWPHAAHGYPATTVCLGDGRRWPCPTVRAIAAALSVTP